MALVRHNLIRRYDILTKVLFDNDNITTEQMKNALDSVSKDNF